MGAPTSRSSRARQTNAGSSTSYQTPPTSTSTLEASSFLRARVPLRWEITPAPRHPGQTGKRAIGQAGASSASPFEGAHTPVLEVADRHRQGVGGIRGLGQRLEGEQEAHHRLHLTLVAGAVARAGGR